MNYSKLLKKAWNFINSKVFGYIIVALLVLSLFHTCNKKNEAEYERKKSKQNIEALRDSVKNYKNKWGETVAEKKIFVTRNDELKDINSYLKDELDKTEGKVSTLNRVVIKLRQDTTDLNKLIDSLTSELGEPIVTDSNITFDWKLQYTYDKDNYDVFSGRSVLKYNILLKDKEPILSVSQKDTRIVNRETSISLVWGQRIKDKKMQVYVRSPYPGFSAEKLDGLMIDPHTNPIINELLGRETSKWFTGFSVGVGVMPFYNFNTSQLDIAIGPVVGYNIFKF